MTRAPGSSYFLVIFTGETGLTTDYISKCTHTVAWRSFLSRNAIRIAYLPRNRFPLPASRPRGFAKIVKSFRSDRAPYLGSRTRPGAQRGISPGLFNETIGNGGNTATGENRALAGQTPRYYRQTLFMAARLQRRRSRSARALPAPRENGKTINSAESRT